MRTTQDIYYGITGQSLFYDCPEGRPSSVTSATVYLWDVADDDTSESAISGSPAVETNPNTTVDAASGYGQSDPRQIHVTATTGAAIDRTYLIMSADGAREWFETKEIDSGNYLIAKHPLHNAYAAADTVQSTRITATVDATWVADETNLTTDDVGPNPMYRVRWVYVVAGVTHVADTYFNLVRYAARHGVLPQDIEALVPGWLDTLPTDHRGDQGRKLIDDAYREVRMDLHQVDLAASSVAQSEIIDELVRYKLLELGERSKFLAGNSDSSRLDVTQRAYTARLDSLIRVVSRVPVRDETGAATPVMAVGLTRR